MDYQDYAGGITTVDMARIDKQIAWEDIDDRSVEDYAGWTFITEPIRYVMLLAIEFAVIVFGGWWLIFN